MANVVMEFDTDVFIALSSSSGMKRSSLSPHPSPIEKRSKLDQQQAAINDGVSDIARCQRWQSQIDDAGDDSAWRKFFSGVICMITNEELQAAIIPPQTKSQSIAITKGFSENELREWKDAVQKGVKEGNWTDLITHREYLIISEDWTAMNYCDSETSS
jgi:hypothetical protein